MASYPGKGGRDVCLVLLISLIAHSVYGIKTYTVSAFCRSSTHIDLQSDSLALIELDWINYQIFMNCKMQLTVPVSHRIMVQFLHLDVDCSDTLQLYDGSSTSSASIGKYCGIVEPSKGVVSTGNDLLLEFVTGIFSNGKGFKLLLTPYHTGICSSDKEFACTNGRCIDHSFYCNDYDNCGDSSDACYKDHLWWVWMIVGIVVFIVICVIITVVCCCLCKKSRPGTIIRPNPQSTTVHYSAGAQTVGVPGTNPWYATQTAQTQFQPQTYSAAYPPVQGTNPPASYPGPPPSYTSVSGSSVYPAGYNQQTNSGWPTATAPESIEKY